MTGQSSDEQSILKDSRYLEVKYSVKRAPKGDYPVLLAQHLLETKFHKTGRLLDIGSGRGDFLSAFSQLGFEAAGVDISPLAAQNAGSFLVRTCNLECEPLPFMENEFDFVFSKSVIEHLHSPHNFLRGAYSVLKPGGIAVIMTPSWEHTYWGPFYVDNTHVCPYTIPSLTDVIQMSGFQNISTQYFFQLPFVWKYPLTLPLVRLFSKMPLSYRPFQGAPWPESFNKLIRFSKEAMLLAVCQKPIE